MRSSSIFSLLVFLVITFILSFSCNTSKANEHANKKNILILNSYHVGYKWSDEIYQGIIDELSPLLPTILFHVEYMDMKRHYSSDRFETFFYSLKAKYNNITIDYIISSDDTAFLFLKQFNSNLFPEAKIIFCGTNYLEEKDLGSMENFYGITEKADIVATLDLMMHIHPETENIYIINDTTVTGNKVANYIAKAIRKYQPRIRFILFDDISMEELLKKISSLPPRSLILYTFFFKDAEGNTFEYNESMALVAEAASVPIYGTWDFNLGFGIIGGMLTSGYHQGEAAGKLVKQLLADNSASGLPRVSQSPNRFKFDYAYLQKHDVAMHLLPDNAIIVNKPFTFYEKHKRVLLFSAFFILFLLVIIAVLVINITRRKSAERQLRQSIRNFKGIFDNATEGLFQASLAGRFLKANDALAKILGCDSPEDVIHSYTDLKHDLHVFPEQRDRIIRQVSEHGSAQMEVELYCKDGSRITALLCCHNVTDDKGQHLYFEGSITDMTEYKKTQEVIIQSEKLVSLGGLSAGIAHEIKNPLTSIIQASHVIANRLEKDTKPNKASAVKAGTSIESIQEYVDDRDIPKMLSDIIDSGNRAHVIIEDMLSFGRKSIGEFSMEPLDEIIHEAVALAKKDYSLERAYNFHAITVSLDIPEHMPHLYCSRTKLQQVLFNLLKNSAEAMAEANTDKPAISISVLYDNDSISIKMSDNGPGVAPEDKEKIFEPFYTTKGGKKGTGLGLSIAYFIVTENHKGKMTVDSAPDRGTQFTLVFPLGLDASSTDLFASA